MYFLITSSILSTFCWAIEYWIAAAALFAASAASNAALAASLSVYSDANGFQQVQDESAVKEAAEDYRDALTDIQIAEIDKEIALREEQKEALDTNTEALTKLEQNIQDTLTVEQALAFTVSSTDFLHSSAIIFPMLYSELAGEYVRMGNLENSIVVDSTVQIVGNQLKVFVHFDESANHRSGFGVWSVSDGRRAASLPVQARSVQVSCHCSFWVFWYHTV